MNLAGDFYNNLVARMISTTVGIFLGALAAYAADRYNERSKKSMRAKIIHSSVWQELNENNDTLITVRPDFTSTPWGKSFFVSSIAWDTAISSGDLPNLIGFELADTISSQDALLVRIRYYVDLLTKLWFAPDSIPRYQDKIQGFYRNIVETMAVAFARHPKIMGSIRPIER